MVAVSWCREQSNTVSALTVAQVGSTGRWRIGGAVGSRSQLIHGVARTLSCMRDSAECAASNAHYASAIDACGMVHSWVAVRREIASFAAGFSKAPTNKLLFHCCATLHSTAAAYFKPSPHLLCRCALLPILQSPWSSQRIRYDDRRAKRNAAPARTARAAAAQRRAPSGGARAQTYSAEKQAMERARIGAVTAVRVRRIAAAVGRWRCSFPREAPRHVEW
jgi:hypothetical protein